MARQFDRPLVSHMRDYNMFVRWADKFLTELEGELGSLAAAQAAQADATQALADAASAQSDANTAQSTANTAKRDDKITASATVPTNILSGVDAGSNATINIAAHTRQYGDGTSVSINSGSITGRAYSTTYAVYYDDTGTTGGTKTFVSTTTLKDAQPGKVAGRHYCGQITTPASGGGGTSGGVEPPGGGGPYP